ncbi:MAG: hypothetical protein JO147_12165 [Actinobacteria bacterium]|nr:hypothetical protein [Actinomycetota bacterium]
MTLRQVAAGRHATRHPVDGGSAVIEFVFVAVVIMIPLVYFVVALADVQRSSLAVTSAAKEAGRAFEVSSSVPEGLARARVAARLALEDQGIKESPNVEFHTVGRGCTGTPVVPQFVKNAEYLVCVRRSLSLPGVPTVFAGRGITTVGAYLMHLEGHRD